MSDLKAEKKARNKRIKELTNYLDEILEDVLNITGYKDKLSLNAKIGGKNAEFFDIRNEVISSPEHYISLWLNGLMHYVDELYDRSLSKNYDLMIKMQKNTLVMDYVLSFLERMYLRHYDEVSKVRPNPEESVIWIGQENANYGIFVTPRFKNNQWENDGSEIRKFKQDYFTIGHILTTGLTIPFENEKIDFSSVEEYLKFFKNVLVRNSGSTYEKEIAKLYCEYVNDRKNPENVPLLIPEFRYGGIDKKHQYRLDFTIINPYTMDKYGFELSPWSTHGKLTGIKDKTQKQINDEASSNFDKEMKKHKDYFRKYGVFTLIYTDVDLSDIKSIFDDMKKYLKPKKMDSQLKLHTIDAFYSFK